MSKIIAITSGKGGTGKSSICAELGFALAKQGHRTLIIELELIEKYGKAWFDDNGEAINFIVENEYSLSLYNRQGGK